MTSSDEVDPPGRPVVPPAPIDSFLEAKLSRPLSRDNWVFRPRLVDAMDRATRLPVTLVAAPAGYGKTTTVAQWLTGDDPPSTAWVSLDSGDNDPNRLWAHVAAALERVGCVLPAGEPSGPVGSESGGAPRPVLTAIVNALAAVADEIVLVLDDFHFIQHPACHDQVQFLVGHLPAQAHLVIITRSDPGLRLGRLRASNNLAELRASDLCFTAPEALELLAREQVHLSDETVTQLMERTEGWPAGLYLATLSLAGRSDPDDFVRRFSGGNRFIGDYLTEEVLSRHPERVREFITTVSILDRFSADLCDHLRGDTDSAAILHDLERSNLFVVPLDEERRWFRFHHLFAAVALSELEVTHPDRVPSLHARAAEWFGSHGHLDEAIQHSLAAGNTEEAALLIQSSWLQYVDAGRAATVLGWLETLGSPTSTTEPAALVTAAWMAAIGGNETGLAAHLAALKEFQDFGPLPDGTRSVESAVAMIQGLFGFGGPAEMMAGALRAVELETDSHSPYYAIAQLCLGQAYYIQGDLERAIGPLRTASRIARAPGIRVLSLSAESFVEFELGNQLRSLERAELAAHIVNTEGLRASPQAFMAFTALGQAQAAVGNVDEAMTTLESGPSLQLQSSVQGAWGPIQHLLVAARVAALAGRAQLAREQLAELATLMSRFTDGMTAMRDRAEAVRQLLREEVETDITNEPLTDRELDVLRLLARDQSLHQIATELYLSVNTVKTHTRAVYRKLGVHARGDALRIARRRSLL